MQECWWGIPLRKIWGWARHRRHLLTCHWCPASRLLSYLFPSLSVLHPFKSYRRFAEASRFFLHSSRFAPIFFQYLCLPVSVPVHLPPRLILSVHPLLFLSLSHHPCFFLFFLPDIWANNQCHFIPVREQMEFQLRAWQRAANKGFFCDSDSLCLPLSLQQRPQPAPGPCHLRAHIHTGLLFTEAHRDPIDIYRMWGCT